MSCYIEFSDSLHRYTLERTHIKQNTTSRVNECA